MKLANEFTIRGPAGEAITAVDEWRRFAPPKKAKHWKPGRSAQELATAWVGSGRGPALPEALLLAVGGTGPLEGAELHLGLAEHVTRLPYPGEGRNHDLLLLGRSANGPLVVGIEAKADEEFGDLIHKVLSAARKKARSNLPARVNELCEMVFGSTPARRKELLGLRYQLLHATAGVLLEAATRGAAQAVLLVHAFRTPATKAKKLALNERDFEAFVAALKASHRAGSANAPLVGPLRMKNPVVPGSISFYIGKVETTAPNPLDPQ